PRIRVLYKLLVSSLNADKCIYVLASRGLKYNVAACSEGWKSIANTKRLGLLAKKTDSFVSRALVSLYPRSDFRVLPVHFNPSNPFSPLEISPLLFHDHGPCHVNVRKVYTLPATIE